MNILGEGFGLNQLSFLFTPIPTSYFLTLHISTHVC